MTRTLFFLARLDRTTRRGLVGALVAAMAISAGVAWVTAKHQARYELERALAERDREDGRLISWRGWQRVGR